MMRWPTLLIAIAASGCDPAVDRSTDSAPADSARGASPSSAYAIRGADRPNWTPGWRAVILGDRILIDSPTSAGWYSIAAPAAHADGNRRTYGSAAMTLAIEAGACTIPAYRAAFPDRVALEWDGGRFEGCGGPRALPSRIDGAVWELARIGNDSAPAGRTPAATLVFGPDGALGGTLACNDGGIRTRWTTAGGFATGTSGFEQTAMGCNDPDAEAFGMRFWGGLMTATAWRRDGERLRIVFADGSEAELRLLL